MRLAKVLGPNRLLAAILLCLAAACPALGANDPNGAGVDAQTVHRNAQELWRSNISAPRPAPASTELDRMASEVQALTVTPKSAKPPAPATPVPLAAPAAASEPNAPAPASQPLPAGPQPLDADTIERLKRAPLSGPVGKIALADSLFAQDQLEGAAAIYKEALAQDKAGRDKDWILFQIGNCLRASDANAARGFYQRVSAECPGSTWATIAATERQYLDHQQEPASNSAPARGAVPARGAGRRAVAAAPTRDTNAR